MVRQLTISSIFRKRKWMKNTNSPKLTISGKWLENAGFAIGDKIKIEVKENQLVILKQELWQED